MKMKERRRPTVKKVSKGKNKTNQTKEREKLLTTVFVSASDIWETLDAFGLTESKKYPSYK
jgi:hypothetical protein